MRQWLDLTAGRGESMVVKPAHLTEGRIQPGIKVPGQKYLRIIYGSDYTDSFDVLRHRFLGKKRQLTQREHGLGIEALAAVFRPRAAVEGPRVRLRRARTGVRTR
jgi:hypothetical protein